MVSNSFHFFESCLQLFAVLMTSEKMATLGLLKEKVFWSKVISVQDVTNKIISRDSNYIADVVIWSKFGNYSISMREVIITSILEGKKQFFEGCFWFKFNNLKLALGMALKFNTKLAERLKLKVRKFWELIPIYVEVIREKLVGALF